MITISKFDAADYLKTPEAITAYLTEALATDDADYVATALDTLARVKRTINAGDDHTHGGR
jgi:probable addiction module antidote protein